MFLLIFGLLIFLGAHSVRIFAEPWRMRQIERRGEPVWKALFGLVSLLGFVLIVWGYGQARADPAVLWSPPVWTRHLAALLTLPAFILLTAAYVPGNRLKSAVKHPMVLGVKLWAVSHLIANGMLADLVLFGAFLVWAVLDFRSARQRDRASAPPAAAAGSVARDVSVVLVGGIAWVIFATYLHEALIGVRPFG